MIREVILMKKSLCLLLALLLLCSALPASAAGTQVCLNCGQESKGNACAVCGELAGSWICIACGTKNLSSVCMECGLKLDEHLARQAADPRPLAAFPAVRYLAAKNMPEYVFMLGRY